MFSTDIAISWKTFGKVLIPTTITDTNITKRRKIQNNLFLFSPCLKNINPAINKNTEAKTAKDMSEGD